ncbi:DNA/RNA polymerase [Xylariaceae sp. FL0662B]|nr:DNA/RNA polymerase [Xylariaceae sp. FL0662B]
MLVRPPPARRSLSLSRLSQLRRPQLASRHPSLHSPLPMSTHRLLVTRPDLAPWRRKTIQHTSTPALQQRLLATAMGDHRRQDDIPFDRLQTQIPNNYVQPSPHLRSYDVRAFDPSSPLLVKTRQDPFPRARATPNGIPGGVDEMLSVFDACLQVGRLDRAALVLERFGDMNALPHRDLIVLHNMYLRAAIDRAFDHPDSAWAQSLHKWYELHIRNKGIPQTPETIACMLKVSLLSAQGPRLERLVTRYMDMMPGDAIHQVLSEVDVLSQQDFGTIASIYQPASSLLESWGYPQEDEEHQRAPTTEVSSAQPQQTDANIETPETPEVLSTPQRGLGLKSLRGILRFFSDIEGKDISELPLAERREIQARLEEDCVESAITRWREEHQALIKMGRNTAVSSTALNSHLYEWQCSLENRLQEEFAKFDESEARERKTLEDMDRCLYAPFLRQSNPTRLAAVTILSVLNSIAANGADKGTQLAFILSQLSKSIEEDIQQQRRQSLRDLSRKRKVRQTQENAINSTLIHQADSTDTGSNVIEAPVYDVRSWPTLIRTKVGIVSLSALIECAKVNVVREHPETKELVTQIQPAMAHTSIFRKGKRVGMIMANKYLVDLMKREPRGDFLARHLPMLVEPEPWSKFDKGGFLQYPGHLIRIKNAEKDQRIYAEAALKRGDMEQIIGGLDVLGRTGWQINKPVFNVMLEAWNSGQSIANIPELNPQIPVPPEPELSDDPMRRREWLQSVKRVENEKSALHSERCYMNLQLEIARAFKDQTFYFPHNMDFRGRAYPIPTYLNHMGADHVRGLLRFAKGKKLGTNGIRWLKVHLANVFGYDKASLKERETFATDHMSDIVDSATNPLTGNRWWLQAEDAWQCLATCFELKAVLESPEPAEYLSHLPIHQDGTCNGLQHYAALGGDSWGAAQVNLEPGDRPADVYTAVAELVKESIAEDLKADSFLAKALHGKITRKVVKQTVMTNVYGVTWIGARAQVLKQLDALYPNLARESGVPAQILAAYVATKTFRALSAMFQGAHDIQYWLGECAGRICRALTPEQLDRLESGDAKADPKPRGNGSKKSKKSSEQLLSQLRSTIVWTTPLRMPVVQPYRKTGTRTIATSLQDLNLQIPERSDPVNRRKQLQAFPPNFIHSLDASHMLLSALECDERGLTFAAVHDSFWTHAADVDVMNRVLRDAFIRIHSEDVIGRLASEFKARYKGSLYLATLPRGSPAEEKISAMRKNKKYTLREELFTERERLRLLNSEDPEEVEKGRQMVTPGSIFEELSVSQPSSTDAEMEEVGLGSIPDENMTLQAKVDGEHDDDAIAASEPDNGNAEADLHPAEDLEHIQSMLNVGKFEAELKGLGADKKPKPKTRSKTPCIHVWLPLTFPDIPKKGDFDVTRLKHSKYFFS